MLHGPRTTTTNRERVANGDGQGRLLAATTNASAPDFTPLISRWSRAEARRPQHLGQRVKAVGGSWETLNQLLSLIDDRPVPPPLMRPRCLWTARWSCCAVDGQAVTDDRQVASSAVSAELPSVLGDATRTRTGTSPLPPRPWNIARVLLDSRGISEKVVGRRKTKSSRQYTDTKDPKTAVLKTLHHHGWCRRVLIFGRCQTFKEVFRRQKNLYFSASSVVWPVALCMLRCGHKRHFSRGFLLK